MHAIDGLVQMVHAGTRRAVAAGAAPVGASNARAGDVCAARAIAMTARGAACPSLTKPAPALGSRSRIWAPFYALLVGCNDIGNDVCIFCSTGTKPVHCLRGIQIDTLREPRDREHLDVVLELHDTILAIDTISVGISNARASCDECSTRRECQMHHSKI